MLVSTTIIESGLDIPQANTLIVERADKLGLAQLYQIRGRVGRSRERAYAYLLYPSAAALSARGRRAAGDALRLHRARLGVQDRDARPRDPRRRQPARRRAVGSRRGGRLRALLPDAGRGGQARSSGAPARSGREAAGSRCASTCRSTPTSRPTTSPTRWPRSTSTAGSPPPASRRELSALAEELEDRFGAAAGAGREPDPAPGGAHQARPGGRADGRVPRRAGSWSSPLELDSGQVQALREDVPRAPSTSRSRERCGSASRTSRRSVSRPSWTRRGRCAAREDAARGRGLSARLHRAPRSAMMRRGFADQPWTPEEILARLDTDAPARVARRRAARGTGGGHPCGLRRHDRAGHDARLRPGGLRRRRHP